MKKQNGFTLIELVVVIVILGILAVTAAPKFLNLQDDAKVSAVKGLAGAMKGAAGITYGKAAVSGVESLAATDTPTPTINVEGKNITLNYGYPQATSASLGAVVDGLSTDWSVISSANGTISYGYAGFNCVATYTEATSSASAIIAVSGTVENCEKTN